MERTHVTQAGAVTAGLGSHLPGTLTVWPASSWLSQTRILILMALSQTFIFTCFTCVDTQEWDCWVLGVVNSAGLPEWLPILQGD